jgi:hypothetical protein
LIFIDHAVALPAFLTLFVAGIGWLLLRDYGAAVVAIVVRLASLPFVWLALYVLFAGFACDDGCSSFDSVAKVVSVLAVLTIVPVASTLLLARRWRGRVPGRSEAVTA